MRQSYRDKRMFTKAEVGSSLSKHEYKTREPEIHSLLLSLQQELRKSSRSLVIIVSGVEGAGKGEVVDRLNRWFDTRDVRTHAFWDETDEERQRPRFWRFWRALPTRGSVAVMFGSWYTAPIVDAAYDRLDSSELEQEMQRINELEKTLSDDGVIIVKFWFHLSKADQQQRLQADANVSKFKKSPLLAKFSKSYDKFRQVSEQALSLTDTDHTPWHIIEASDLRFRDAEVGNTIITILQETLHNGVTRTAAPDVTIRSSDIESHLPVLDKVDLTLRVTEVEYEKMLETHQRRLHALTWEMYKQKRSAIILLEGWDAAGKGSALRRLTAAIDARLYRVIPIAAPTDEEQAHHYLWRFWRQIPRCGYMSIYDRSWYGRVLVERVEGFAAAQEWMRAYEEINSFEDHLARHGITLFKFWIHIDQAEQLRRFKEREMDSRKQHKITADDWRNREKWPQYEEAVEDMVTHTSTTKAPWTLISGNDKNYARIQIIETVCRGLEEALGGLRTL